MNAIVRQAAESWIHVAPLFVTPTNDEEYDRLVDYMDQILSIVGGAQGHPLALLASRMGDLIEAYDEAHRPMPVASPVEVVRYLMQERGLSQSQVPEIGPQSVVSEILNGHRTINVRQAKALGERFNLPATVFLQI